MEKSQSSCEQRDGVGSANDVELVVVDQRTAGLRRDVGELDQLLLLGLIIGDAQDGSGDLVAQVDLETLVLVGSGIEVTVTDNVLLNAGLKLAAALDCLELGGSVRGTGACVAAATGKGAGAGDAQGGEAEYLNKLTTIHIHGGTPSIGTTLACRPRGRHATDNYWWKLE